MFDISVQALLPCRHEAWLRMEGSRALPAVFRLFGEAAVVGKMALGWRNHRGQQAQVSLLLEEHLTDH